MDGAVQKAQSSKTNETGRKFLSGAPSDPFRLVKLEVSAGTLLSKFLHRGGFELALLLHRERERGLQCRAHFGNHFSIDPVPRPPRRSSSLQPIDTKGRDDEALAGVGEKKGYNDGEFCSGGVNILPLGGGSHSAAAHRSRRSLGARSQPR